MTDLNALESLYFAALERAPDERTAFLDKACRENPELRACVERLLAAQPQVGSFLEPPVNLTASFEADTPSRETASYDGPTEAVGAILAGKYKLTELIGEGGMGSVWLAQQSEPVKRKVAVKLIKPGMDSRQVLARFEAERQALAMMDHPNIAKVLDGGLTSDGRPFFVMELVKGVPITEFCDKSKLTPKERLELFVPVCQAIQHAHQKGVIHRDVKPSNVLIALYDDKPVPKVIDFGIAKATGGTLTEHTIETGFGGVVGTPQYMSPEQATLNNLDIDTRSDVYSLGVLLYELLTGSPPFARAELEKKGLLEMLRVVREEEPPKPSTKLSTADAVASLSANRGTEPKKLTALLRSELDWIVLKALEKDRSRRYETANGLAADVNRYLAGEPVVAHPPSAGYRLKKFARKHRPILLATAAFAVLLMTGAAISSWLAIRATHAEASARESEQQALADRATAEEQRIRAEQREAEAKANEQKAVAAEAAAKESEITAQTVVNFVTQNIFAAPRPGATGGGLGRDVTLRQALDAAEPKIATVLADHPKIESQLRNMLGGTYATLGEGRLAQAQYVRAYALSRTHYGLDHAHTLEVVTNLANCYQSIGQAAEAARLLEQTLTQCRQTLGREHHNTIFLLSKLILLYAIQGRMAEARVLAGEYLAFEQKRTQGVQELPVAEVYSLSFAYTVLGRLDDSIRLLEETLPRLTKKHGPDDGAVLDITHRLVKLYSNTGRLSDAVALQESAYPHAVKTLGYGGITMSILQGLSVNYLDLAGPAESVRLLEGALPALREQFGPANAVIAPHVINLAAGYSRLGQHRKSIELLEATIAAIPEAERPAYINYDFLLSHLAPGLQELGHTTRLREVIAEMTAYNRLRHPADSPGLAGGLALEGRELIDIRRYADAEPLLREALAIRVAKLPDTWQRFNTVTILGQSLFGQKKYTEAEPLLFAGYEGLKARQKDIPSQANDPLTRPAAGWWLVLLYERTGRPEKAAAMRAELPMEPILPPRAVK